VSVLNPKRQNSTLKVLDKLFEDAANVWVIHYSCESFYNRTEGRSPRITSIALRKLDTAQSISFENGGAKLVHGSGGIWLAAGGVKLCHL